MPPRAYALLVLAVALAGCGGSSGNADRAGAPGSPPPPATPPAPRGPLDLPADVPLKPTRAADPDDASVVRAWSDALRAGDVRAASALWAVPARVQNATPVLTLASRDAVRLFNGSLPCGSVVTAAGGAPHGFTIATVRLTQRRGARCDAPAGATARTAIRVRGGKIAEWYRLPDDPDAPGLRTDDIESTTI